MSLKSEDGRKRKRVGTEDGSDGNGSGNGPSHDVTCRVVGWVRSAGGVIKLNGKIESIELLISDTYLLRPDIAQHSSRLCFLLSMHRQQLGLIVDIVLARRNVFMDQRRITACKWKNNKMLGRCWNDDTPDVSVTYCSAQ